MTTGEIIQEFVRIKKEDPKRFYNAMGYGDDGVNIMSSFVSGSYELGLVAGAKYALDHMVKAEVKGCDIIAAMNRREPGEGRL